MPAGTCSKWCKWLQLFSPSPRHHFMAGEPQTGPGTLSRLSLSRRECSSDPIRPAAIPSGQLELQELLHLHQKAALEPTLPLCCPTGRGSRVPTAQAGGNPSPEQSQESCQQCLRALRNHRARHPVSSSAFHLGSPLLSCSSAGGAVHLCGSAALVCWAQQTAL